MMIDWNGKLEAVLDDGSIVPANVLEGPDDEGDYRVDYADRSRLYVKPNGNVYGLDVVIRNVAGPAKPVRTAAEMLKRMEDLTRRLADSAALACTGFGIDARAIVAELPAVVDEDLVIARQAVAEMPLFADVADEVLAGRYDDSAIVRATIDAVRRQLKREGQK